MRRSSMAEKCQIFLYPESFSIKVFQGIYGLQYIPKSSNSEVPYD